MADGRIKKSLLNARVNLVFYFVTLFISFFSRKIFLDCLGADFLGLTGTLGNLLSFLNMAELGIGGSIGYALYKPIYDRNQEKICDIISVLGYLYRIVGTVILTGGIILSLFLPLIFKDEAIDLKVIYFVYYCFLTSSLFGYFVNYRFTLFAADQRGYVVTAYFQTAGVVKTLVQMTLAYYTGSYYLWAAIELSFGVLYCFILNWKTNRYYPWLKTSYALGREKNKEYKEILQKAKQLFVHQIGGLGRNQILPFLIYAYESLTIVAFYGNYMLIVDKVNGLLNNVLNSTGASVGNMIAEGDRQKILKVYWELKAIRYYMAGVIVFALYHLLSPFVTIWLGAEYVLSQTVVALILLNTFIGLTRGVNDQFIAGFGIFADTWQPIVNCALTVSVGLLGGWLYGLPGVLAGSTVSLLALICLWRPYYLFTRGLPWPLTHYWAMMGRYLGVLAVCWIAVEQLCRLLPLDPGAGYLQWTLYAATCTTVFAAVYATAAYFTWRGFSDTVSRFTAKLNKKGQ